jgi:hypothetical protein
MARLLALFAVLTTAALAGDGIRARNAAADYPAQVTAGKIEMGAAYVPTAQVKRLFGEDLEKHGYVTFEIGIFPVDSTQVDISADDFKLRRGTDLSIIRAVTPEMIARDIHPEKTSKSLPKLPENVHVYNTDAVIYQTGPGGGRVYTATGVGVGIGGTPPPPPPQSSTDTQLQLQADLEARALPEGKTNRIVAGYIFFSKPSRGNKADFELLYFGQDGQVSMKLSPVVKPRP